MKLYPKLLIVSLTALLLSGCVTSKGDFCKTEKPYYFTQKEYASWSRETREEIVSKNEYGRKLCGWKTAN